MKNTFLLVLILTGLTAFGQTPKDRLLRQMDSLQNSLFLANGSFVGCVKSTKTGQTLVSHKGHLAVPSASTMKLVATASALAVLNEGYRYTTKLEIDGEVRRDTLFGNVWVVGSGDPSLGSDRFKDYPDFPALLQTWAETLKRLGIKHITGKVVGDDTAFDENPVPGGWPHDDIGNYYGAAATGLTINENAFKAYLQPALVGEAATLVRTEPAMPEYEYRNRVKTGGTEDEVIIYNSPFSNVMMFEGTVPPRAKPFVVEGSIPQPALTVATALASHLKKCGISTTQAPETMFGLLRQGTGKPITRVVHTHQSPNLREIATQCNYESLNIYAEALLKSVGVALGFGNSTENGISAIRQVWQAKGVNLTGFKMKDGSGLAPQNALSPEHLTDILTAASREAFFRSFYSTIPIVGQEGTVKNLAKKTKAAGNVRAKSGTIGGLKGFAGYFTSRSGELMSFAFFVHNFNSDFGKSTKELEKLIVLMVEL